MEGGLAVGNDGDLSGKATIGDLGEPRDQFTEFGKIVAQLHQHLQLVKAAELDVSERFPLADGDCRAQRLLGAGIGKSSSRIAEIATAGAPEDHQPIAQHPRREGGIAQVLGNTVDGLGKEVGLPGRDRMLDQGFARRQSQAARVAGRPL